MIHSHRKANIQRQIILYQVEQSIDMQFDTQFVFEYPPVIQNLSQYASPISGYFRELNLIFVASGANLFFWDYASSSDWLPVEGISHPIRFVELVRFRPDVFDLPCPYGFVVITSADILLFSFKENEDRSEVRKRTCFFSFFSRLNFHHYA